MNDVDFSDSDNLDLRTFTFEKDLINSNDDIIRSIKDENGRLMKLLQEKEFEIKKLKRENESSITNKEKTYLNEGAASMKIIELSKKLRELSSEFESLKTKYNQKNRENKNLENKINEFQSSKDLTCVGPKQPTHETFEELKQTKDKLKLSETKVLELLSSNQKLTKDLKISMKILEDELGDPNIDLNKLINNPSNWRGRSQKILGLTQQIDKLKKQIQDSESLSSVSSSWSGHGRDLPSGATSIGLDPGAQRTTIAMTDRQSETLARMQRERVQLTATTQQELARLKDEHAKLQTVTEGLKSRNLTLGADVKRHKQQIATMLDKARHDDELVASLLSRQDQFRATIQTLLVNAENTPNSTQVQSTPDQNHGNGDNETIARLTGLVASKELELVELRRVAGSIQSGLNDTVAHSNGSDVTHLDREQFSMSLAALETEVTQLRLMLATADTRYQELLAEQTRQAEENSALRQCCVQLERDLQKAQPANAKTAKSRLQHGAFYSDQISDSRLAALLTADPNTNSKETVSELQEALALRIDKIDSLNHALELMTSSKQQDVAMLTEIIDCTRSKFVESIKKLKSQQADSTQN